MEKILNQFKAIIRNMNLIKFLIIFVALFTSLDGVAQGTLNYMNHWYFVNDLGVDFSSGSPVVDLSGKTPAWGYEGSSAISDINGNLLFYHFGDTAMDRNHNPLPNGGGLSSGSSGSTSQGSLIVPKPGAPDSYYLFTLAQDWKPQGLQYNEVDMTLNGGFGDIVAGKKNVPMQAGSLHEQLTAVKHTDGCSYWVLVDDTSNIYAFHVTAAGVNPTPVVSPGLNVKSYNYQGCMKANVAGDRLAIAASGNPRMCDFDASTGVASNFFSLPTNKNDYGCEFSLDGNVLYCGGVTGSLTQYDLSVWDPATIVASQQQIPTLASSGLTPLQMGPDGKIYFGRSGWPSLAVINNPEILGVGCNIDDHAVPFGGSVFQIGICYFPNFFLDSIPLSSCALVKANFSSSDSSLCEGDCIDFTDLSTGVATMTGWEWSFPGGTPSSSSDQNPSNICYSASGNYDVELIVTDGTNKDTLLMPNFITVSIKEMATLAYSSGSYCLTDPDPTPTITGTTGGVFAIDNSGVIAIGTGQIDIVSSGVGDYIVTYITSGVCPDTVKTNVVITAGSSSGADGVASLCSNSSNVNLLDSLLGVPDAGGVWTGPSVLTGGYQGTFDLLVNTAGVYTYTMTNSCGTSTSDVVVTINPSPNSGGNGVANLCPDALSVNLLDSLLGVTDAGGTWAGPSVLAGGDQGVFDPLTNTVGTYTYEVTNSCGTVSSDVVVAVNICTVPQSGYTVSDSIVCEGECVVFADASSGGSSWEWSFDGGTPSFFDSQNPGSVCYNAAGTYTVEQIVSNAKGADTTVSTIKVNVLPVLNAGLDVAVALDESTTLTATGLGSGGVYTWSPSTWLSCVVCPVTVSTPEETIIYTVSGITSEGCVSTDDVTVVVNYDNVIWVPNIFSPNGDGANDVLYVRGKGVESFQFVVYNRWGEKVFETTDLAFGWDGRFKGEEMNKAVFVYHLKGFFKDGNEFNQKGDITLLR